MRLRVIPSSARGDALQAEENEDQAAENRMVSAPPSFQHVADDRAVFAGGGIVVIAVQKNLIDGVADFSLRGFDQSHAQVFRREVHAVEVARDAALRGQDHDRGGVRVLVLGGVVLILEADSLGEGVDGVGRAGQEMPAGGGVGASVALEVFVLSWRRRVAGFPAD